MKKRITQSVSAAWIFTFLYVALLSFTTTGQPSIGILPVNTSGIGSDLLNDQQLQSLSLQIQNHFVLQLKTAGTITNLTREHILLLMKEVPSPDPENLTEEAYKIISKRGKLNYLLRCSLESVEQAGGLVRMPIHVIVVEGNSGKVILEERVTGEITTRTPLTEHILLNKIFKPSVTPVLKKIKAQVS